MSYADFVDADRRLALLRLMAEDGGHANESVLETGLIALGHRARLDREAVRGHLRFLETAGCLTLEFYRDKVMVAALTRRGAAVADGRIEVDGVARPQIGD